MVYVYVRITLLCADSDEYFIRSWFLLAVSPGTNIIGLQVG